MTEVTRCAWACRSAEERVYHDEEWGIPQHDENRLFEFLVLEGAQAGLSWLTVLRKREHYRRVFHDFDPKRVAGFDDTKVRALLEDPGLIRNRLKIESAVANARAFLTIQDRYGSFDAFLWRYVDGRPIHNHWRACTEAPAETPLSQRLSRDLRRHGFRFVGPTICYAYMQAVGLVNDHAVACFRWYELGGR